MKKGDEPIIVEEIFETSISAVWNSITNIDQMRQWYFGNIPAFKPEVGFETRFNVQSQDRNFVHMWRVTEVVPLKKIKYNWRYDNYPGDSFITFELFQEDTSTKLVLTCDIVESFPDHIPEFTRESCYAGWKYFVNERLKDYLKRNS